MLKADLEWSDTRTNCQSVGLRRQKFGNPNQRPRAIVALRMLHWLFSGCCEGAQRVKFRSSISAEYLLPGGAALAALGTLGYGEESQPGRSNGF